MESNSGSEEKRGREDRVDVSYTAMQSKKNWAKVLGSVPARIIHEKGSVFPRNGFALVFLLYLFIDWKAWPWYPCFSGFQSAVTGVLNQLEVCEVHCHRHHIYFTILACIFNRKIYITWSIMSDRKKLN